MRTNYSILETLKEQMIRQLARELSNKIKWSVYRDDYTDSTKVYLEAPALELAMMLDATVKEAQAVFKNED